MQRLQHRGRAEEVGVKLDYLDKLHNQHEKWLVERSTELVPARSRLCCFGSLQPFKPSVFPPTDESEKNDNF